MKVIGVIQLKGWAGRSTLSTNLAGELSKIGKTVLIDYDMPEPSRRAGKQMSTGAVRSSGLQSWKPTGTRSIAKGAEKKFSGRWASISGGSSPGN